MGLTPATWSPAAALTRLRPRMWSDIIDHILRAAGVDHVGLEAGSDEADQVPPGLEDVRK